MARTVTPRAAFAWAARGLGAAGLAMLLAGCAEPPKLTFAPAPTGEVMVAAADAVIMSDVSQPMSSPYGAYLAGLFAGHENDLSSAADFMLQALASDPQDEQLLSRSFVLVASDGRQAATVELARRLIEREPGHELAALVLAVDEVARGDFAAADARLEKMPSKGLGAISAPLLRAWIQVALDDVAAGLERLAPLKDKEGFGTFYNLHVGLMHEVAGRSELARAAYEKALADTRRPSLRLVWLAGGFFERAGQVERAEELYRSFLEQQPDSMLIAEALQRIATGVAPPPAVENPAQGMAEALFNLASLLSQERAEEVALIYAHQALRLHPDFLLARVLLGEILQEQGRRAEAIALYRQVPAESPFAWMVRLRIAEELESLDRGDEAIAELEALASVRPDRFEPLLRLGNLHRTKERYKEAVAAYNRAAERIGEPDRRHWVLYYFRGISYERLSEWPRAEADFLRALELQPDQPFVLNYLAYSWVEKKLNLDRAKAMLARAVELRPEDGFIVDSLGWVYYRLGEYDKGVHYLERAVELRPQDPVINDHLGDAYWRVGRLDEARFQWRRALSLKPEADLVPTIESKIERGIAETETPAAPRETSGESPTNI